jgi:3'-5' exoribonuclease
MKSPYISELQPNQQVLGVFLVQAKELRQKKTGEPYLSLQLSDKTGDLEAKMWDNVSVVADTFERDDFVRVKGLTQVYQNRLQLTVHRMTRMDEREVDFTDYFPASARDPDEMLAELRGIIAGMRDPDLRTLLEAFFADEDIVRRYKMAPAAKTIHHAWLGGLIEHVLSLGELARFVAAHYRGIDLDLLLAGVILHDVGKIDELTYERGFSYSDDGQLLGHIIIALGMLDEKLRGLPGFPRKKRTLLEHMIVSHHGQLEFGSPKVPLFPEALLLHQLDLLDSKMECMHGAAEKDSLVEGNWSAFSPALERVVLKKQRYIEGDGNAGTGWPSPAKAALPQKPAPVEGSPVGKALPVANSVLAEKLQQALRKE